jgi:hypothetical protein
VAVLGSGVAMEGCVDGGSMYEEERGCHWIVGVVRCGRLWDGEEVFMCESFSTLTL